MGDFSKQFSGCTHRLLLNTLGVCEYTYLTIHSHKIERVCECNHKKPKMSLYLLFSQQLPEFFHALPGTFLYDMDMGSGDRTCRLRVNQI